MEKEEKMDIYEACEMLGKLSIEELVSFQILLNVEFKGRTKGGDFVHYLSKMNKKNTDDILQVQSNTKLSPVAQLVANVYSEEDLKGLKESVKYISNIQMEQ